MIEEVARTTNFTFEDIFRMPAEDFFAYISYINERTRREFLDRKKQEARLRASLKK